jgi:hypothetical protein
MKWVKTMVLGGVALAVSNGAWAQDVKGGLRQGRYREGDLMSG